MPIPVVDLLVSADAVPGPTTDAMAWVVIALFGASALLETGRASAALDARLERVGLAPARRWARRVAAVAWLVFAAFWLVLAPHFLLGEKSVIEGVGTLLAVPACLYTGYLVWTRRPSLLVLSRAVTYMGLIYLPFLTVPGLREVTVEMVTRHTELAVEALGYEPQVVTNDRGYRGKFLFTEPAPYGTHRYVTPVLLACSGIGSISIVAGLVLAVRAPLRRKLSTLAVVVPLIYALNIVRTTFIVVAFSKQWFQYFVDEVMALFATQDPHMVSYYVSDKIISQSASVVVLVAITLYLLRRVPSLTDVVEEALYVLTGREVDLGARLDAA